MQSATPYHNTTGLKGNELKKAKQQAKSQDDTILNFFSEHRAMEFTPCQVYETMKVKNLLPKGVPITSIRRAITNLTSDRKLIKTGNKRLGAYGRTAQTWKANPEIYKPLPIAVQGSLFNQPVGVA